MKRTITMDAAAGEVTETEIEGLANLLRQLNANGNLDGFQIEIQSDSALLEQFAYLSVDSSDTSTEIDQQPVTDDTDTTDESESYEPPEASNFDNPEDVGEAWREYFERTGEMPPFNSTAGYATPIPILVEAGEPLATAEIATRLEGDVSSTTVSGHLYTLLKKGIVTREETEDGYAYEMTEFGNKILNSE